MKQFDIDQFSKEELLDLEAACDSFERDVQQGNVKAFNAYLESDNKLLLELATYEFEKIRLSENVVNRTQTGPAEGLKTLAGDDSPWRSFAEGQLIERFRLVRKIGQGATSQVWQAHDLQLARDVAIKFPKANQSGILKRFARESKAVAKLRHNHIVSVHEVCLEGETPFLVSDLIVGESLAERMEHSPLSIDETVELMIRITDAIEYSHQQEVLHRDIKPQNILLDKAGSPFVTDFGLARFLDEESEMLTREGDLLGTPAFMSPEQASGSKEIDQRTDVYSLGVILFQLLTRDLPFRGNIQSIMYQILSQEPMSPRIWNASVPKDLETVCLKCLAKNPKNRFQTAQELSDELTRFQKGIPIKSRPVSGLKRCQMWVGRNRLAAASVGLIAFLLVGIAIGGLYFGLTLSASNQKQVRLRTAAEASAKESNMLRMEKEAALNSALLQKSIAEQKAMDAENAFLFLGSVFQESEPVLSVLTGDGVGSGDTPTLDKMFRNAAKRLELQFPGDPSNQSRLADTLGNSCRSLGLFSTARDLFELANRLRSNHPDAFAPEELAEHQFRNSFFVGQLLHDQGDLEKAKERYRLSLQMPGETRENKLFLATVRFQLGRLYLTKGRNADAKVHFEKSVQIREQLLPSDSPALRASLIGKEYCQGIDGDTQSLTKIGRMIGQHGWPAKAARLYLSAHLLRKSNDLFPAVDKYRELVTLLRDTLSENHPLFLTAMGDFAGLLWDAGKYRDALGVVEFVIERAEKMAPDHYLLKEARLKLGREYHRNGEHAKAIVVLEGLLDKGMKKGSDAEIHHCLLWCYLAENQVAKARISADALLSDVGKVNGEVAAWIQYSSARVYESIDPDRANELDQAALKFAMMKKDLPGSGFWSRKLAIVFLHHNRLDKAEEFIRHAIKVESSRFHDEHPRVATCRMVLAQVLVGQERREEARMEINRALDIRIKSLPQDSKMIIECKNRLVDLAD